MCEWLKQAVLKLKREVVFVETQFCPLTHWDGEAVLKLGQCWRIPSLMVFERLTSTNDLALREAECGAAAGTTIIAEEQIRGRGRNGRTWLGEAGKSLLLSIILPPSEPGISSLQEKVAITTAQALRHFIGGESVLKVPNDVVSRRRRKLAGVLVERASTGHYVAGIGINVAQDTYDWPIELRASAESLRTLGVAVRRSVLAGGLIEELRPLMMGHPLTPISAKIRRSSSATAVIREGNITVRVDADDHCGIWTHGGSTERRSSKAAEAGSLVARDTKC
jgi:biotin-[acetyl-CoA-carboxylase] ligase BirA-like protein